MEPSEHRELRDRACEARTIAAELTCRSAELRVVVQDLRADAADRRSAAGYIARRARALERRSARAAGVG